MMKTTKQVTVATLALILITLMVSSFLIPAPLATANPTSGTILWKQECPWTAQVQVQNNLNDHTLIVFCTTLR